MRGTSVGVQRPSSPAWSGWDAASCSGRLSCTRRSGCSGRERSVHRRSRGDEATDRARPLPSPVLARINGTAAAPAASPVMRPAPADDRAMQLRVRCGRSGTARLSCGQLPTQFMHIRHSDLRHGAPPMGSSPPWQWSRQRLHLSQLDAILVQPEYRPARNRAQQCAQRADRRGTRSA